MTKKRILVVEDDPHVAADIKIKLERLGYEVPLLASTADQALEAVRVLKPDLVLMDVVLPGEHNGIDAAGLIRTQGHIPVVYVTAHTDPELLARAKVSEPFGYIVKPVSERELEAVLAMALYKHAAELKVRQLSWLAHALMGLYDPVFVLDLEGRLICCNRAAAQWLGIQAGLQEAPGPWHQAVPLYDEQGGQEGLQAAYRRVVEWGHTVRGNGRLDRPVDYTLAPIRDERGLVAGAVLMVRDVSEQEALVEQLRLANKALESFVYTVSHDLKTPLVSLGGFVGLLEKDLEKGDLDTMREDVRELRAATARMAELVNGLLKLSRAGRTLGDEQEVDLGGLVGEVIADRHALIEAAGAVLEAADRWPRARVDPLRIKEVLGCLVDNALKYTRPGVAPRVALGWREDEDGLHVYVQDNGRGIRPADQERIFELFERAGPGDEDGSGVGLALARRSAEAHGGSLTVDSTPGRGSTFWLHLPRERLVG